MTPVDHVAITRGARVQFRAVVERIAWPGGDIILTDVRRLDGRAVLTTGFRKAMSPGPRNMADLARVLGMRPSTLHLQLTGRRPMPAETAAAIRRALPEIGHE